MDSLKQKIIQNFFNNYAVNRYSLTKNIDNVLNIIDIDNEKKREYFNFSTEIVIGKVGKAHRDILNSRENLEQILARSQFQLQQAQSELARSRSQFQIQQTQSELAKAQAELAQSQFQLQQTQKYFEDAINEISSMETSKFWKLRQAWFEVKRLASLSRQILATDGISGLVSRTSHKIQKKFPAGTKNNISLNLQISNLEAARQIELPNDIGESVTQKMIKRRRKSIIYSQPIA